MIVTDYQIRPAIGTDAENLTTISFASKRGWKYPEHYYKIWKDELTITQEYIQINDVWLVEDRKPFGYYSVIYLKEDLMLPLGTLEKGYWLEHMFILPEYIGKEVGRDLFNFITRQCIEHGIGEISVLADPNSRGFYEKMGCTFVRNFPSTIAGRTTPQFLCRI